MKTARCRGRKARADGVRAMLVIQGGLGKETRPAAGGGFRLTQASSLGAGDEGVIPERGGGWGEARGRMWRSSGGGRGVKMLLKRQVGLQLRAWRSDTGVQVHASGSRLPTQKRRIRKEPLNLGRGPGP